MAMKKIVKTFGSIAIVVALAGCATPGHIVVKTMSMQDAYNHAQGGGSNIVKQLAKSASFQQPLYTPPPGIGIVEAPKVAMAYVYPWVDANDTLHMGTWVGIPITGFRWKTSGGVQSIPNVNQSESSISGDK
ncbi:MULTISPECIES: TraV family lipoprotein [Acidithiobacillus]|jgi:hypothetical protein|uniref:TraV family lipoprotein n=1 Tax=Acidithiobacillus TaxID=119977 RepID=UPI00094B01A3|nr:MULTISPECIES: TraV family lipoprotein [Acidithiobacillus]MDD2750540.1 TraV family lipoprotein [Acidithiobacillus sp.]MDD5278644.1 TraV family lipoprotein [Acidithiobacillus sp.]